MIQIKKKDEPTPLSSAELCKTLSEDMWRIEGILNELVDDALIDALSYELLSVSERRRQCIIDAKRQRGNSSHPLEKMEVATL